MNIEEIGKIMFEWVVPIVIFVCIVIAFVKTTKRNISNNAVGFLLIMLSLFMGSAPSFVETSTVVYNDWYKFIALLAGLLGTAICAVVTFKDQAASNT